MRKNTQIEGGLFLKDFIFIKHYVKVILCQLKLLKLLKLKLFEKKSLIMLLTLCAVMCSFSSGLAINNFNIAPAFHFNLNQFLMKYAHEPIIESEIFEKISYSFHLGLFATICFNVFI